MKIKSEIIWAFFLLGTAAVFFYLGTITGESRAELNLKSKIAEQNEKILVLETQAQQLSEELKSRGIFSYPQANIVTQKSDSTAAALIILNGKDPIQDLSIQKRISQGNARELFQDQPGKGTYVGNLTAHNPVTFEIPDFKKALGIDIIFKAGRKSWYQYIRAKKTSEGKIKTFWVITNENSEVIDKHIDPGFPLDNGYTSFGKNNRIKYSEIKLNSIFNPE